MPYPLHHMSLMYTYYSIQHCSFICPQSNGTKYSYVIPIIQLWHTVKEFHALLLNTYNPIQCHLFVFIQCCNVSLTTSVCIQETHILPINSQFSFKVRVWFALFLLHINYWRFFNAKFFLYISHLFTHS